MKTAHEIWWINFWIYFVETITTVVAYINTASSAAELNVLHEFTLVKETIRWIFCLTVSKANRPIMSEKTTREYKQCKQLKSAYQRTILNFRGPQKENAFFGKMALLAFVWTVSKSFTWILQLKEKNPSAKVSSQMNLLYQLVVCMQNINIFAVSFRCVAMPMPKSLLLRQPWRFAVTIC